MATVVGCDVPRSSPVPDLSREEISDATGQCQMILHRRGEAPIVRSLVDTNGCLWNLYYRNGEMCLMETDKDHDGTFEGVVVLGRTIQESERFTRNADGTLNPLSSVELDAWRTNAARGLGEMLKELSNNE